MKMLSGLFSLFLVVSAAAGCGGAKVLKEPKPVERTAPLMIDANEDLTVALVWIIVRDGPGTWAKNADWDEYHLVIRNLSGRTVKIQEVDVTDSLGQALGPLADRELLVHGTKVTKNRYENADIEVKAGFGAMGLLATGTVVGVGAMFVAASVTSAGAFGMASTGAALGVGLIAVPTIAILAIRRGINNSRVHKMIEKRHTPLPLTIDTSADTRLTLFYPLMPGPQRIVIEYAIDGVPARLEIDTSDLLKHLHLPTESLL